MSWRKEEAPAQIEDLTERELEVVTSVFRSFETGLREATIYSKDLHAAMKMIGLNPMEQEIIDLTNEIARNGLIYFPEFCSIVNRKFKEEDEEVFRQNMFKMLCGTEPLPELFRAKKYKINDNYILKQHFRHMMVNLPVQVSEEDIEEMFSFADTDKDGRISYKEFQTMINPPRPPEPAKPTIRDFRATKSMQQLNTLTSQPLEDRDDYHQLHHHYAEYDFTPTTCTSIPLPNQIQTLSVSNILASTSGPRLSAGFPVSNTDF